MTTRKAGYRVLVAIFGLSLATLQLGLFCWAMAHTGHQWLTRHFMLGALSLLSALLIGLWQVWRTAQYSVWLRQFGITTSPDLENVRIIEVDLPLAFCAGLIKPQVYLSQGLIERLSPKQLRAVVDHETYHRRKRDPLRILLIDMLSAAFFFLPAVQEWRQILRARLELDADTHAVSRSGRATLAGALHNLLSDDLPSLPGAAAGLSVSSLRVATLLGERHTLRISTRSLLISTGFVWLLCLLVML